MDPNATAPLLVDDKWKQSFLMAGIIFAAILVLQRVFKH